jgi:acyl-coenzyme A thioesterase PaaI-like protein
MEHIAARSTERLPFADISRLTPREQDREPGLFDATLNPEWTTVGRPNGGYLLALACRAAVAVSTHPHVIAASAHYLRSPDPGPVVLEAEVLRAGRSASQVRARLSQDGRSCVEALITASALGPSAAPYWDRGAPQPGTVRLDDCVRLTSQGPNGLHVAIMDQVDMRLEPESLGFAAGRPSGRGELRGWLALPDDEPFDPFSLMYAADAYPPATFDIGPSGWVPTLELTVYVRALPSPGPVQVLQRAVLIDAQRVDEECTVWDQAGRLVAQSRQLAAIRLS